MGSRLPAGQLCAGAVLAASPIRLSDNDIQPVDDEMHHFMEYVFEPNYKRLKASMAAEPTGKQTHVKNRTTTKTR